MELNSAQRDRACGALLATAAGDALGAAYEFGPPRGPELEVAMVGGGAFGWEPGEWTDDTSMAVAIAEIAAEGADLRDEAAADRVVRRWYGWMRAARDVGAQTSTVLSGAGRSGAGAATARAESARLHRRTGHTAGNGSLMRTAPVALAYLGDEGALVETARAISELTHFDPEAGDACVLWCCAIRHAVLTGEFDARGGLRHLPADRRDAWSRRLDVAESSRPADIAKNGWAVAALQAAWSAIATTDVPADDPAAEVFRADHLRLALDAAVRAGGDTDTVAAIAGGLLGGVYGASAVPAQWRRILHGWPGIRARDLVALADAIVRGGKPDGFDPRYRGWTRQDVVARHPYDDKMWLGGMGALRALPDGVDAVVSLCRVGDDDVPAGPSIKDFVEVRLIDRSDAGVNVNLDYVLTDTVRLLEQLRREGRTVLLHCVEAHSRTPTVAALYGSRRRNVGVDQALADVRVVLPDAQPNPAFLGALRRLS